jgi:hypothetical protein
MYRMDRYPSSDKPVEPEAGEAPASVLKAVKLMYAGAAFSVVIVFVSVIVPLTTAAATKATIKKDYPHYSAAQVNHFFNQQIVANALLYAVCTALWLWMARADGQGRNWARITSSVLFGLATVNLFLSLNTGLLLAVVFGVLPWVIGLGAIILLWRRESSEFFKPRQRL